MVNKTKQKYFLSFLERRHKTDVLFRTEQLQKRVQKDCKNQKL